MNNQDRKLIIDYIVLGTPPSKADVFIDLEHLQRLDGEDIIQVIIDNKDVIRTIKTNEIPQFSNENKAEKTNMTIKPRPFPCFK